ncbi:MAG: EAL domain-containing protein [Burkholderiaceae bacterium]
MRGPNPNVTERSQAQAALADKQHVLTAMQQTTQLGFWFVDNNGITTDVNPAMCEMLGQAAPAVLGKEIYTFFDSDNALKLRKRLANPLGPRPGSLDLTLTRPAGSVVRCLVNVTPITNVQGESVGLVGMFSDLTVIDETRRALTTAEFVVNSVSDMVSLLDRKATYLLVNDAWCRALGLTRDQAIGRASRDVVPALSTPERTTAFRECLATGEPRVLRAMVQLAGSADRFTETTLTPFRSERAGYSGVVAVTRDITEQEATRRALAHSLENLRRTFNATIDGMFAYNENDPSGRLLFVNDRFLELWEIPLERAALLSRADVMAASRRLFADPVGEEQRLRAVLALQVPHEDRVILKDGRIILRHSVPLKDQSGVTWVWSFRDITLQERAFEALRSSESQQRAVMDAFPGYVGVIDARFTYRYVNQRLADLMELSPAEMVGRSLRDLVGEERFAEIAAEVEIARRVGRAVSTRTYEATATRTRVDLQVTHVVSEEHSGPDSVYYAFGVDITDRVQAEDAVVLARDEAERANRAKSAFLASVSHELKTPLNAILGFSQLLRADPQMASASSDNAGEIERAGQHLLSLVDDLIDLGQVESGALELTMARIPLESVINESLSLVAPLAAKQGIRIVYSGGDARNAMVMADATRLRQVVINLLSNAIKYNRPEGTVHVSCERRLTSASGERKPCVRIGVNDTGMGISADRAASMFSAFDRLGAERGSVEGTGIGLVITKRLVNAMGGDMGYQSEVGRGSLFWVELAQAGGTTAAASRTASNGQAEGDPPEVRHRPRLLVAEDYAPNQAVLRLQLAGLGCEVDVVNDGTAALTKWSTGSYDLILTDLDMPVMDGLELARAIRLREKVRGSRIPIIALSAALIGAERARCLEAGMDDVLAKPIAAHGLGLMLSRWVDRQAPGPAVPGPPDAQQRSSGPDAAVLDLDRLYGVLGRVSGTQAQALLSTFLEAAEVGLREMGRAGLLAPMLLREMHRQRSSAGTVGAVRYAALAATLERDARSGVPRNLEARLAQLSEALSDVVAEIERLHDRLVDSAPVPLAEQTQSLVHGSVLVVDDDPVILMQMTQMLRGLGLREVLTARNGLEAMQLIGRRPQAIDVVVCDLNMPEMDGVEMIRRFGQSNFGGALILMSGADEQILSTVGKLAILQGLTVLGQIHKPVTPQAMAELLSQSTDAPVLRPATRPGSVLTPEAIRDGIALGEFLVWLQPKVDAVTLLPIGVEALARWRQPDGSYVPPDVFIVMAERSGLIAELSGVLVAHALTDGARLHAAGFPLKIAINLSAVWLDDLSLPDLMLQSVDAVGLTPGDIILEVTETGVTKDVATALDVLSRLRLKGFGLSIDDFGIGYSSFEQVGRIPFTEMKLDRSFVNRGARDAAARAILESSMAMAQKLNLRTVAEGVETQVELDLMHDLGCDGIQGYLIAHPMPVDELVVWLQQKAAGG